MIFSAPRINKNLYRIKFILTNKRRKSYDKDWIKRWFIKEFESGIRAIDVANSISEGLARAIVGAKINGEVKDLKTPINDDAKLEFVKFEDKDGKEVFWHTSTHVMAQAIKRLYPEAKLAIGPAIENGFYYDIDLEHRLSPEDLEKIEAEMKKIVKRRIWSWTLWAS